LNRILRRFFHILTTIPLVLRYSIVLVIGLILIKTLEYQLFSFRFSFELYSGLLGLFFLLVGIAAGCLWLKLHPKTPQSEPTIKKQTEPLTIKEQKLLEGLLQGMTNQQLADNAFLSVNTIKTHLKSIYKKLGVTSRAQAAAKAKKLSLNKPHSDQR
jgi:DNA-binding CsgD family transcriptional regulator